MKLLMAKLGPLPDVANVLKVRLIGQQASSPWVNVIHVSFTGAAMDQSSANSIATAIRGYWNTSFAPLFTTSSSLQTVEVTDLTSRTGVIGTDTTGATGSDATAIGSLAVAACLTLKVAKRYRGGHPRMYLAGVNATVYTNGKTWTSTRQNAYQSAGRAFLTAINAMIIGSRTYAMCAVSYYTSTNKVVSYKQPPQVYPITDVVMHSRVDSMRRRLGKETT